VFDLRGAMRFVSSATVTLTVARKVGHEGCPLRGRDEEADHFWFLGGLSPGFAKFVDGKEAFRHVKSAQGERRCEEKGY
jgi:hypothetical protein